MITWQSALKHRRLPSFALQSPPPRAHHFNLLMDRTQTIAVTAAVTTVASLSALGYVYREQIKSSSVYQTAAQQASTVAAKSGEVLKALQTTTATSASKAAETASAAGSKVAASLGAAASSVAATASTAATSASRAASTVATSASAAASSIATTASSAASSVSTTAASAASTVTASAGKLVEDVRAYLKQAKSRRSLRRVRSFPIVHDAEDVDDVADKKGDKKKKDQQADKSKSKSPRKPKASPKKATEPEKMGVPVQVMAR